MKTTKKTTLPKGWELTPDRTAMFPKVEFLKPLKSCAHEQFDGTHDKRVRVIGEDGVMFVIGKEDGEQPEYPIGAAWLTDGMWHAVMGSCWVGKYKDWDDALHNIEVAYFG
jgi:hypothetical protein